MTEPAIVLIGPMGAGKTSIGKRVAKQLGLRFADSDAAVVRAHGPIDRIFAEYGMTTETVVAAALDSISAAEA